ncbi:MAG: hypothetical protein II920_00885 [Clostridia bacterium]|nr:hypothetical protein [Clostridia bacterium]
MAKDRQQYDRFQRGQKRQSGTHGSYAKNVSKNAAKKGRAQLNKTVVDVLLCALVPPYGVYRVWTQEKNPPILKIVCTLLSLLIMFLWFLLIIPESKPDTVEVSRIRSTAFE